MERPRDLGFAPIPHPSRMAEDYAMTDEPLPAEAEARIRAAAQARIRLWLWLAQKLTESDDIAYRLEAAAQFRSLAE